MHYLFSSLRDSGSAEVGAIFRPQLGSDENARTGEKPQRPAIHWDILAFAKVWQRPDSMTKTSNSHRVNEAEAKDYLQLCSSSTLKL